MITPEGAPQTLKNRQFPLGDINDAYKEQRASDWFARVEGLDGGAYRAMIRVDAYPLSTLGEGARKTDLAAVALCKTWDAATPNELPFSQVGYRLAMAFNRKVQYLPNCRTDLTGTIEVMQIDQARLAHAFARSAWAGLELYPNVQNVYARLLDVAHVRYGIGDGEEKDFLAAGMILPYMLAWADRLIGYTPDFRALPAGEIDLEKSDFAKLFIKDVSLAPEPTYPDVA